jgi:tubulin delta
MFFFQRQQHQTCVRLLGCERPTFGDMNAVAAQQLAGVLLPAARRDPRGDVVGGGGSGRRLMLLHDVSRDLCCHSMTRLLSLRQTPTMPPASVEFTTFQWPSLVKRARQMLLTGTTLEEGLDWGLEPGGGGGGRARKGGGSKGHRPSRP